MNEGEHNYFFKQGGETRNSFGQLFICLVFLQNDESSYKIGLQKCNSERFGEIFFPPNLIQDSNSFFTAVVFTRLATANGQCNSVLLNINKM